MNRLNQRSGIYCWSQTGHCGDSGGGEDHVQAQSSNEQQ